MRSARFAFPKQFSLRALFLCVSLVAVFCGWMKIERDRIARWRAIVAQIHHIGGSTFDRQTARNFGFDFACEDAPIPNIVNRLLLGETVRDRPQWVFAYGSAMTDQDLIPLHELKTLRHLTLADTKVTDAGVAALQRSLPKCEIHRR